METKVVVKCISKKETISNNKEHPIATAIELEVPYDQSSIYWRLSGGTNFVLNTINEEAAAMFKVQEFYTVRISKANSDDLLKNMASA